MYVCMYVCMYVYIYYREVRRLKDVNRDLDQ